MQKLTKGYIFANVSNNLKSLKSLKMAKINIKKAEQVLQNFEFWKGNHASNMRSKMVASEIVRELKVDDVEHIMGGGVTSIGVNTFWTKRRFKEVDNSHLVYGVMLNLEAFTVSVDNDCGDLSVDESKTLEFDNLSITFDVQATGKQEVDRGDWQTPPSSEEKWGSNYFSNFLIVKDDEEVEITDPNEVKVLERELNKFLNYEY